MAKSPWGAEGVIQSRGVDRDYMSAQHNVSQMDASCMHWAVLRPSGLQDEGGDGVFEHRAGADLRQGGRTVRCARAVRKVGCFPPPVATDPKALNSAPYHPLPYTLHLTTPLLVHQKIFFSLMLATGPRVLNSAPPPMMF